MNRLEALNELNDIAFSYFVSQSFATATSIGLFDRLDEPRSLVTLAAEMDIHPDGCRRLLAAMENLGLVAREAGRYKNSELGAFVSRNNENPIRLVQQENLFYRMWEYLPDALREYSPRFEQALGTSAKEIYGELFANEARLSEFFGLMDSYSLPVGIELSRAIDFQPYDCILDVAGGSGGLSMQVAETHDHLCGIIFELPPVCSLADKAIARRGLQQRFRTVPGDMLLDPFPAAADVVFLSWILHNYADPNCELILRRAFEALPSAGLLVVSEKVLNSDGSGSRWGVMMSLQMLVACEPGAKERSLTEYQSLLEKAGFVDIRLIPLDAPRDIIVARKP